MSALVNNHSQEELQNDSGCNQYRVISLAYAKASRATRLSLGHTRTEVLDERLQLRSAASLKQLRGWCREPMIP